MKQKLFLFLCLLSFAASGQNWRPFRHSATAGYSRSILQTGYLANNFTKAVTTLSLENCRAIGSQDSIGEFNKNLFAKDVDCFSSWGRSYGYWPLSPFGSEVQFGPSGVTFFIWDSSGTRQDSVTLKTNIPANSSYGSSTYNVRYDGAFTGVV